MGRKREFDYDRAIEQAMRVFWAKGYSNASLRDLLKAMRIGESSFYNWMRSKKALYLACLKHYNATVTRRRWEAFSAELSVKAGVRSYFAAVLDDLDDPKTPNVCLMAGSLSADVLSARDLQNYVLGEMRTIERALIARIDLARETGELPKDFDSAATAAIVVTYLQGLFRVVRTLKDRPQMERQIDVLLTSLGL
jgi:TetR/AcrR family transcriptional regulator, transcriptional repressor for nem operon